MDTRIGPGFVMHCLLQNCNFAFYGPARLYILKKKKEKNLFVFCCHVFPCGRPPPPRCTAPGRGYAFLQQTPPDWAITGPRLSIFTVQYLMYCTLSVLFHCAVGDICVPVVHYHWSTWRRHRWRDRLKSPPSTSFLHRVSISSVLRLLCDWNPPCLPPLIASSLNRIQLYIPRLFLPTIRPRRRFKPSACRPFSSPFSRRSTHIMRPPSTPSHPPPHLYGPLAPFCFPDLLPLRFSITPSNSFS